MLATRQLQEKLYWERENHAQQQTIINELENRIKTLREEVLSQSNQINKLQMLKIEREQRFRIEA